MNALVPVQTSNAEVYRASTDAAGLCREIVLKTAQTIQGRKYVKVEGWQAIAIAHGCAASADHVERVDDEGMSGFKALGIVRRMSDGAEIARAEGFLGDDESMWAKRPVYARRAMVQTRAISRACRSAFAHVVVLIDAGLSTTPAEEVPLDGFGEHEPALMNNGQPRNVTPPRDRSNGVKRLSSARAKEVGLHDEIKAKVDALDTSAACDAFEERFDAITAQCPMSWLDSIRNMVLLKREEIQSADKDYGEEFDRAFAGTVGQREAASA